LLALIFLGFIVVVVVLIFYASTIRDRGHLDLRETLAAEHAYDRRWFWGRKRH